MVQSNKRGLLLRLHLIFVELFNTEISGSISSSFSFKNRLVLDLLAARDAAPRDAAAEGSP